MSTDPMRCPGCDADLGPRRHCLTCDIQILPAPNETCGWLARLRGTLRKAPAPEEETGARAVELELGSGKELAVQLASGTRLLPEDTLPQPDSEVEILATRLLVFDQGGLREAPRQEERLVARVFSSGPDAAALMDRAVKERVGRQQEPPGDEEEPEIPWPEGFRLDPRPGRHGWRLRLHIGPQAEVPVGCLFSPLIFCGMAGLYLWISRPTARWGVVAVAAGLLLLAALVHALRRRAIVLDPRRLSVQRGFIRWPRRHVAPTDAIRGVSAGHEEDGARVDVLLQAGGSEPVVWGLQSMPLALFVAHALQTALGLSPRELSRDARSWGRLPDMERLLRPLRGEQDPATAVKLDSAELKRRLADPPSRVRVTRTDDRIRLRIREAGVGGWLFYPLPLGILWLANNGGQLFTRAMPIPLLDGLACGVTAICAYGLIVMIVNHTRLDITAAGVRLRRAPLPWPGGRGIPLHLLGYVDTDSHLLGKGAWTYSLHAILRDGQRVSLLKGAASQGLVSWLRDTVTAALDLTSAP